MRGYAMSQHGKSDLGKMMRSIYRRCGQVLWTQSAFDLLLAALILVYLVLKY